MEESSSQRSIQGEENEDILLDGSFSTRNSTIHDSDIEEISAQRANSTGNSSSIQEIEEDIDETTPTTSSPTRNKIDVFRLFPTSKPNPLAFIKKLPQRRPLPRSKSGHLLQHRHLGLSNHFKKILRSSQQKFDLDPWSFTPDEDHIIRTNWEKFREKFALDGHIFEYCRKYEPGHKWKTKNVDPKWYMWPSLCDGLPNRYARTVQQRIAIIFDENYRPDEDVNVEIMKKQIEPEHYFQYMRFLYKSAKPEAASFDADAFDWTIFQQLCELRKIRCPTIGSIMITYGTRFRKADNALFRHLRPVPDLKQRMIIMYEALARWDSRKQPERYRKHNISEGIFKIPQFRIDLVFSVVYEQYTKTNPDWEPPLLIAHFMNRLDAEKTRKRLDAVREQRQREKEREESGRTPLRVRAIKLRARSEGAPVRGVRFAKGQPDEELELSTILADQSDTSNLTQMEVTLSDVSGSFRADETILAGGGRAKRAHTIESTPPAMATATATITGFESLILPEVDESARKRQKTAEKFSLDDSFCNIWDQLNQN